MTKLSLTIALTFSVVGCIDDELADELSSAEQEVGGTSLTGLLTCNNGSWSTRTCPFELSPDDGFHACFLAGVKGSLNGSFANLGGEAVIVRDPVKKKFVLEITPPTGANNVLSASAVCVSPLKPVLIGDAKWQWNEAAANLGNQPGMQCFLTGIQNFGSFKASGDKVTVFQLSDNSWRLGGTHTGGGSGSMRASANCIIPTGGSLFGFGWAWNNGTNTFPLAQNTGGIACGLNTFQGTFTTAGDRISLGFNSSLAEWNTTLAGTSHTMGSRCFD